jgi:hypothetical protein
METTEHRARILELAAPPGGWPNLTSELVEVRFYLQQGLLDHAYDLLSILQRRYPGHPQLVDLARKPKASTRVDTDVLALVDAVLAESVNLVAKMPRRQAPKWKAPSAPGPDRTQVHSTVAQRPEAAAKSTAREPPPKPTTATARDSGKHATARDSGKHATARDSGKHATARDSGKHATATRDAAKPATTTGKQKHAAKTGGQKATQRPAPMSASSKAKSGPQTAATTTGRRPLAPVVPPPAASPRGRTELYKLGDAPTHGGATPPSPASTGHTMVVDALQPAAPWQPPADEAAAAPTEAKRGAKTGRKRPPEDEARTGEAASSNGEGSRKRRAAFGEHVLNRLR